MLEHIRAALASSDPATLIGSAAVAVFILVLAWRKFLPSSWNWLEMRIPLIDKIQSDALWTFTWKAVQAIPGTLFGALMVALASGGDVQKTLLGALAGPVAAIGHEVLKRYKGQTGKPGNRSSPPPPFLGGLALCAILIVGCAGLRPFLKTVDEAAIILCDGDSSGVLAARSRRRDPRSGRHVEVRGAQLCASASNC